MFRRRMTGADAAAFKFLLQNYQVMYYTLEILPDMGQPFGQVFMAENGKLFRNWKGSDCPKEGNWLVHVNLCETATTVLAVSNGVVVDSPKWQPNSVFSDGKGSYYAIAAAENKNQIVSRAGIAGCGYMINRQSSGGGIEFIDKSGESRDVRVLFNEVGTAYRVVNLKNYALVCKEVFGYTEAEEVEPLCVLSSIVGTPVSSLGAFLRQDEILVKRLNYEEPFKMTRQQLEENYELHESLWKPKPKVQRWVKAAENICAPYGGGFLFLPRPMINITDEDNVYAIRHEVFSGNEIILGSHKILKRFLPKAPLSVNEMREISAACKKEQDVSNVFVVLNWQVRFEEVPASIYQFIE